MSIKLNVIDLPKDDYTGGKSTLCPGCGHDQISTVIINSAWENGLQPEKIAKMSGMVAPRRPLHISSGNRTDSIPFTAECLRSQPVPPWATEI